MCFPSLSAVVKEVIVFNMQTTTRRHDKFLEISWKWSNKINVDVNIWIFKRPQNKKVQYFPINVTESWSWNFTLSHTIYKYLKLILDLWNKRLFKQKGLYIAKQKHCMSVHIYGLLQKHVLRICKPMNGAFAM